MIERLMNFLFEKTRKATSSTAYELIASLIIFANPLALTPQVWLVLTSPSVEGVSITMWIMFAFIQLAISSEGIKAKNPVLFFSMFISFLESITVILAVLIRT